jgi:hypothetical protein
MSDDDSDSSHAPLLEKLRPWLIGAGAALVMGGFYYFLATRGPRAAGSATTQKESVNDEELRKLAREVDALEARWHEADAKGQGGQAEARAALMAAVEKQRQRVRLDARASPAESERLRDLEQKVADAEVRETLGRISTLETEAQAARASDRQNEALTKMRTALTLLEAINRSSATASLKDLPRESRLKLDLEIMEAEPLNRRVMEARARAERAAREERWGEVRTAFEELRVLQARINREFPRTPFVDPAAEDEIESRIQSLQATVLAQTVRDKAGGGEQNARAGRHAEAARLFGLAFAAQEEINAHFPRSQQYSVSTLDDIEARRQTALSMEGLVQLERLDLETTRLLSARDVPAALKKISESAEIAGRVWRDFPRSRKLDAALRERVVYRAGHANVIMDVQAEVFSQLRSFSSQERRAAQLFASEVPQSLYARVMDKNPSRNGGEAKPVDSVNWMEAGEFCVRLGWLLGRDVRLPSEEQYRVAASGGAEKDFAALRGGVAEWLHAPIADTHAIVAGGSYLDAPEVLANMPMERILKTERARHVGFRIVVE